MTTLSPLYINNTPAERRGLRAKVERRNTALNQEYLSAAAGVVQVQLSNPFAHLGGHETALHLTDFLLQSQSYCSLPCGQMDSCNFDESLYFYQVLDQIQRDLDGLTEGCQQSKEAIVLAQDSTSTMLADTDKLHRETAANKNRSELIQKFLQQYQLQPSELAALQVKQLQITGELSVLVGRQIEASVTKSLRLGSSDDLHRCVTKASIKEAGVDKCTKCRKADRSHLNLVGTSTGT